MLNSTCKPVSVEFVTCSVRSVSFSVPDSNCIRSGASPVSQQKSFRFSRADSWNPVRLIWTFQKSRINKQTQIPSMSQRCHKKPNPVTCQQKTAGQSLPFWRDSALNPVDLDSKSSWSNPVRVRVPPSVLCFWCFRLSPKTTMSQRCHKLILSTFARSDVLARCSRAVAAACASTPA